MNAVATEKQVDLITKLTSEKDWTNAPVAAPIQEMLAGVELSRKEASAIIDMMFKLPSTKKFVKVTDGFYILNDTIYKVQTSPTTGNTYAKKLVTDIISTEFVYAPGMVTKLAKAEKLTLELAKKYGKLYGMCVICGRTLTNEQSIADGIGPICGNKL